MSILVALAAAAALPSPGVTVVVHGVASGRGAVSVALCPRATFLRGCALARSVRAARGDVAVAFPAVPAGRYAVMAFHDENGNGRLDRSEMGVPVEGYGFSRDASGRQGPPSFDDAAIDVRPGGTRLALTLRY